MYVKPLKPTLCKNNNFSALLILVYNSEYSNMFCLYKSCFYKWYTSIYTMYIHAWTKCVYLENSDYPWMILIVWAISSQLVACKHNGTQ